MTARSGVVAVLIAWAACGGKLPETSHYQLASPGPVVRGGHATLVLDSLTTEAAYDDERIVYRTSAFRVDFYQYHRWTSSPGVMVGAYLERALEATGRFRAVLRAPTPDSPVILAGRILAIEEVDRSKTAWVGRIALELVLTDAHSGEVLWTEQYDETEPLQRQTPEALAGALSVAMSRVVAQAAPAIAALADQHARAYTEPAAAR